MAIYNTSDIIDNSMLLKAKFDTNMVDTNYYIENLQQKRDRDWKYRYNVVNIEEELDKQIEYTPNPPCYTPIDVVIRQAKSKNKDQLMYDWAELSFRELKHPNGIGSRYRFTTHFERLSGMSEEEKHNDLSVWICVDKTPINAGNACTVRRCNSFLSFIGSPDLSTTNISEVHYEPCILDTDLKNAREYYHEIVPTFMADCYATMQLNYFTNRIKVNDRFILGTVDTEDRNNNQLYKVKSVIKSNLDKTFVSDKLDEIQHTPLILVALDKDMIAQEDNLNTRVAQSTTVYQTEEVIPVYQYYIKLEDGAVDRIYLGETANYEVNVYYNDEKQEDVEFMLDVSLKGILEKNWSNYFTVEKTDINKFKIRNLKACNRGALIVNVSCVNPGDSSDMLSETYEIELGGFY